MLKTWRDNHLTIPLIVAGDGPLRASVEAAQAKSTYINYVGQIKPEDLINLYRSAALLIIPSLWYEGLPQTLLEAFAVGVPVIVPRHGAFPKLVKDGENGFLFDSGDSDNLAFWIRSAFSNRSNLEGMRTFARLEFEAKYKPEQNYKILMGIYESVLNE